MDCMRHNAATLTMPETFCYATTPLCCYLPKHRCCCIACRMGPLRSSRGKECLRANTLLAWAPLMQLLF
jgi:hypothetical protein